VVSRHEKSYRRTTLTSIVGMLLVLEQIVSLCTLVVASSPVVVHTHLIESTTSKAENYVAEATVYLPWYSVVVVSLLLSVVSVTSATLKLGLQQNLFIAAVRCIVQLSLLGYVLMPVFRLDYAPLTLAYMLLMVLLATREAYGRPRYVYGKLFLHILLSVAAGVVLSGVFGLGLVLRTGLNAQYGIPLLGMLLGNSLSGISVSLNHLLTEVAEHKANIQALIVFGATRWEASREIQRRSTTMGLTTTLNQMAISGVVAIPGMMTGQILGGTPPDQAARYQIVLLFLIVTCCCTCVVVSSTLAISTLINKDHIILDHLLHAPEKAKFQSIFERIRHVFVPIQPKSDSS